MKTNTTLLISILLAVSACGVSTPGGYVLGTTGYLAEVNRGHGERIPERERTELAKLVTKGGR